MDVHQVNSRALHDYDPGTDNIGPAPSDEEGADGGNTAPMEKSATAMSAATSSGETYPEGGTEAWLVVLGSWFALFSSLGLMNTIGIFQAYTLEHQLSGHSEGTVGWVFSIYTFLAFFCGVYIGPVFDNNGPRWLTIAGAACTVGGVIAMSFCTELWHFILSYGVLCGIGTSLLFTPCIASVGHWFRARRGFATGMAATAGGIGGIIYPLMLTDLFERVGYGWATRVLALLCLVSSAIGVSLVKSRLPPAPDARARPDARIFRRVPFLLTTIGIFLLEFSLFIPLGYISTYAVHVGFSKSFAYHLLPIMNAGSVAGRALPGYYADVVGAFNTCIGSVVLSTLACLCVWLPAGRTAAGVVVFAVVFGFASGTSIAIAPVCIGKLCRTQEYGRYYATAYSVVSFACLVGIPIAGSIVGAQDGGYTGLIVLTGVVYVASGVFLVWAKIAALGLGNWKAAW